MIYLLLAISVFYHGAVFLKLCVDNTYPRTANCSREVNFEKMDLQVAVTLLAFVNCRHEFANDRIVDDFVKTFMCILSDCLCRYLPFVRQRRSKHCHIVPKIIRRLILKKNRLWKR